MRDLRLTWNILGLSITKSNILEPMIKLQFELFSQLLKEVTNFVLALEKGNNACVSKVRLSDQILPMKAFVRTLGSFRIRYFFHVKNVTWKLLFYCGSMGQKYCCSYIFVGIYLLYICK
jgi:hypothetical protein